MSKLDEIIERLQIEKAKQAYDLAELVMHFHNCGADDQQRTYDAMVYLAKRIIDAK